MIILDTNVASESMDPDCHPQVKAWLNRQTPDELYLTAVNLAELSFGIAILPAGRKKTALNAVLAELLTRIGRDILPFDEAAALAYAELMAVTRARGVTVSGPDGQIAAIAMVHGYAVATRDVGPFVAAGVAVVNPWDA